jgi:hypothetical protein
MRFRLALLLPVALLAGVALPARGAGEWVIHERIAPDARDDLAMGVSLQGEIAAAIESGGGVVSAPDPARPPTDVEVRRPRASRSDVFAPDRDTSRPDIEASADPFTPGVSPFVRVAAYDAVDDRFQLRVSRPARAKVAPGAAVLRTDDRFYGDLVLDVAPGRAVPIPTVGPETRLVHARLGVGGRDLDFQISSDPAGNWFLTADAPARARLVVELAVARAAFGGVPGDPSWTQLPAPEPLPANVALAAAAVSRTIGVSRQQRPSEVLLGLVAYFRAFVDSDVHPPPRVDIYTDLALSQKGVCRHRAYAFTITALSLGLPTRMVTSDTHAWVEVHDGALFRRIDLGGAGRVLGDESLANAEPYLPPADPFAWPAHSERGADSARRGSAALAAAASSAKRSSAPAAPTLPDLEPPREAGDDRPPTTLTLQIAQGSALRGGELSVGGVAESDGERCPHLAVDVLVRFAGAAPDVFVGSVATDGSGAFESKLSLPARLNLGDHLVFARTRGDGRCGPGASR